MTKNEMKVLKMNLLGGMDTYIRNLNDERAYDAWSALGVPDDASEDDLEWIAENVDEWSDVCRIFGSIVSGYVKDDSDEFIEKN